MNNYINNVLYIKKQINKMIQKILYLVKPLYINTP